MTHPEARRPLGRPRSTTVDRRLLDGALGLLQQGGPAAVNMEAVAARSGVAKSTIYRRFRDRHELLRAAVGSAVTMPTAPPVEDARERLAWALAQVRVILDEVLGPGGVAATLEDRDPDFTALVRDLLAPYNAALARLIEDDVEAGRLRKGLDSDAMVTLLLGSYLGELLRRGEVGPEWVGRYADLLWHAIS
jgi:AcrR family transcriptional regulator